MLNFSVIIVKINDIASLENASFPCSVRSRSYISLYLTLPYSLGNQPCGFLVSSEKTFPTVIWEIIQSKLNIGQVLEVYT